MIRKKIILIVICFLYVGCIELGINDIKSDYIYFKYETFLIKNNQSKLITLAEELVSEDYKKFVRLAYSADEKIFVEYNDGNEEASWNALTNFKQVLNVQSIYEIFKIPLSKNEALKNGFIIEESDKLGDRLIYSNNGESKSVWYYNEVLISKARIHCSDDYDLVLDVIACGTINDKDGKNREKELLQYLKMAREGESVYLESRRKLDTHMPKFYGEWKKKIEEILIKFPSYAYGIIDMAQYAYYVEKDKKKAIYYIEQALNREKNNPLAYAYLYTLNFESNNAKGYEEVDALAFENLLNDEYFFYQTDTIRILMGAGKKPEAKKILAKIKKRYAENKYQKKIEESQKYIDGQVIFRQNLW